MNLFVVILLAAAVVLFVLSTLKSTARPWMVGIGLALFSLAFLAPRLDNL